MSATRSRAPARTHRVVACLLVALGQAYFVDALADVLPFNSPILESIDDDRRVSGDALIGVIALGSDGAEKFDRVHALFHDFQGDLVLRASTVDGRYYAEIGYSVSERISGWHVLDLPASTSAWLNQHEYSEQSAALLLRDSDTREIMALAWNVPSELARYRAYINAERANAFVIDRSERRRIPCARPEGLHTLIYNQICDFPATAVSGRDVEIQRRDGIRVLTSIRFSLAGR